MRLCPCFLVKKGLTGGVVCRQDPNDGDIVVIGTAKQRVLIAGSNAKRLGKAGYLVI